MAQQSLLLLPNKLLANQPEYLNMPTLRILNANKLVLLCLLSLLHGCSIFDKQTSTIEQHASIDWTTLEPQLHQLSNWELFGKVNIRTPNDSITAAINKWKQIDDLFSIDLSSTFLGLGSTHLSGSSEAVTLIEPGEDPKFSDQPDLLIAESLGLPLPITYLKHWIKAAPVPEYPAHITFNQSGLPATIEQEGWRIEFSRYKFDHSLPLPGKIKLTQNDIRITLAIKEWSLN